MAFTDGKHIRGKHVVRPVCRVLPRFRTILYGLGLQYASNSFFNVTGRSTLAMIADLAKELLGVIPMVWLGSVYFGAAGVLYGQSSAVVLFGLVTGAVSYRLACHAPDKRLETISLKS